MEKKWALVTGASGGIGLALARQLAARNYDLVLVARSKDALEGLALELRQAGREVLVCAMDLSRPDAAQQLFAQTEAKSIKPEVLINNAGIGCHGKFLDAPSQTLIDMLRLNTEALVMLSHLYGKEMKTRKRGYMLQVASTAAFQPLPYYGLYAATKSLVLSFSRSLSFESSADGVSSTALCPGPTATGFFLRANHTVAGSFARMMMTPEDVAAQGLEAMFARRDVCVAGLTNKISSQIPRFLPTRWLMRGAATVMK